MLVLAAVASTGAATAADEFEQHGVHEHGRVTVNVALDGSQLAVELLAPAINVVGFERAPRDDAERKRVADAAARLRAGRGLVGVPPAAACRLESSDVQVPESGAGGQAPAHDHEGNGEHGAHDGPARGDHADYRASLAFRCGNPAALKWVELWLLRDLREVAQIEVNVVTPRVQRQQALQGTSLRVPLE